jgi:hypothetical protein
VDAVGQADIVRTSGQEPFVYAMVAEIAFLGDALGHVKGDGFVRARIDTGSAPRASVVVHDHDAVLSLVDSLLRTGFCTGRSLTVPAHSHIEDEAELALLFPWALFLHADEWNAVGGVHFLLARDFACPAPPAQLMIDAQSILPHLKPPNVCPGRFHAFSG